MLPVIDLKDFPHQSEKLLHACKELGCFRIANHGIPNTLLSEMKSVLRSLFDLPVDIKQRNTDVIPGSGYRALGTTLPPHEGLGLFDAGASQAVEKFCDQLAVTSEQRETIKSYSIALHDLGLDVCCKIAESIRVGSTHTRGWQSQFQFNKYHFTEESVGCGGLATHTDPVFLTVLQEDEFVGGLEVMLKSTSSFIPVDALPGSLLVNLGDMATIWSNGIFHTLKHRVHCKEANTRISIALFIVGPKEAVEVPPEFVDDIHPRLYVPIPYYDYRKLRISTGNYAGEVLDLLRLKNID